jgi:hypothetical protein
VAALERNSVAHVHDFAEHFVDELEPLLESIILEDFNVQAEDGSPGEVCTAYPFWRHKHEMAVLMYTQDSIPCCR